MQHSEGIERLRTLYSVLAGIPNKLIALDNYCHLTCDYEELPNFGERVSFQHVVNHCGSTACALGWAALYPPFVKQGLRLDEDGDPWYFGTTYADGAALFFDMGPIDAGLVFGAHHTLSEYTSGLETVRAPESGDEYPHSNLHPRYSQKRVALHRIRLYLLSQGAITQERSDELAKFEEQFDAAA